MAFADPMPGRTRRVPAVLARSIAAVVILTTCGKESSGPLAPDVAQFSPTSQEASAKKSGQTLTLAIGGTGSGSVKSAPDGFDCDHDCKATFATGAVVTLSAKTEDGSLFTGWSGACSGAGACTVTMDAAKSVTATFTRRVTFALTVTLAGTGNGMVKSTPKGIACGGSASRGGSAGSAGSASGEREGGDVSAEHRDGTEQDDDASENCRQSFDQGAVVTLQATAIGGSVFAGWSGACVGSSATCTVTLTQARAVTATFNKGGATTWVLTVAKAGLGAGDVASAPAGITCGPACSAPFAAGTVVTLTATPNSQSTFAGWTGGGCTGTTTCAVTMSAAASVTATFVPAQFAVTAAKTGTGGGIVATADATINCGATCVASYAAGTSLTLTATPDSISTFDGWTGACTGTGPCTFTVNGAQMVTASFTKKQFALTVARVGTGAGLVSATAGPGIDCGATCVATYDAGTTVTLVATPQAGSTFAGWTGACTGMAATCTVPINAVATATATFALITSPLTIIKSAIDLAGTAGGTVTSSPAGIACGATCGASMPLGTSVTLTAAPDANSVFSGWSGACTSSALTCTFTLGAASVVTAQFAKAQVVLAITRAGTGMGIVASTNPHIPIACAPGQPTCLVAMDVGTVITLQAVPSTGSFFQGWSGACSGVANCTLTMDVAKSVMSTFNIQQYTTTVARSGTGSGTVSTADATITCGSTCAATYAAGTSVTLTAAPDVNSTFDGWSGACTGTGPCTFTVSGTQAVTASFTRKTYVLTVALAGDGVGIVTSTPNGIACIGACTAAFDPGTVVTLTPAADLTSAFVGWSGACSGAGACSVPMSAAALVTATFQKVFTLRVIVGAHGRVTSLPAGIDCTAADCSYAFPAGTVVTLAAGPAPGVPPVTATWGGCPALAGMTCTVSLTSSVTLSVDFAELRYPVALSIAGTSGNGGSGGGAVAFANPEPASSGNCTSTCNLAFLAGSTTTLTATSDQWSAFAGWSGDCSGLNSVCALPMNGAKTATATFRRNTLVLAVTLNGPGASGHVTSEPTGMDCWGPACVTSFAGPFTGALVTLTATPAAGSRFVGWSGACAASTGATCAVTVAGDVTAGATFEAISRSLAVTVTTGTNAVGRVVSLPIGIDCTYGTCTGQFPDGATVTLTPQTTDAGTQFDGFTGACSGTAPCTLTLGSNVTVGASFSRKKFRVTLSAVQPAGATNGILASVGGAVVCATLPCTQDYEYGTVMTVSPVVVDHYQFSWWSPPCTNGPQVCLVTIVQPTSLVATFAGAPAELVLQTNGNGTVTYGMHGSNNTCPVFSTCRPTYAYGDTVSMSVTPAPGQVFTGWTPGGPCIGTSTTCTVIFTSAQASAAANFAPVTYPLVVTTIGVGAVSSVPAGITCGTTCAASYNGGTVVGLNALTDTDHLFSGWGGACSGTGACTVTMDAAKNVTATFAPKSYQAIVTVSGTGGGVVSSAPAGVNCAASCTGSFPFGQAVTFTATPDATSFFYGWYGACTGTAPCTVTVGADMPIGAVFTRNKNTLTVVSTPSAGTVVSSPAGITCGPACAASYDAGTIVTLNATANPTYTFTGWGGACTGTGACAVTMDAAKSVTATFNSLPSPFNSLDAVPSTDASSVATARRITVTWTLPAGSPTSSVWIYRRPSGGAFDFNNPLAANLPSPSGFGQYVDSNVLPDATYDYVARVGASGANSNIVLNKLTLPDAPAVSFAASLASATAECATPACIVISWPALPADVTGYSVFGSDVGASYSAISGTASCSGTCRFSEQGLLPGRMRFYRVSATNATGVGPLGVMPGPASTPPPAPTLLAVQGGIGRIDLSWNGASGATQYKIERKLSPGGSYGAPVIVVGQTNCTDAGAVAGAPINCSLGPLADGLSYGYRITSQLVLGSGTVIDGGAATIIGQVTAAAAPLELTVASTAGGNVVSQPLGISCGSACANVTMNAAKSVTADFRYPLTVSKAVAGAPTRAASMSALGTQ